MMVIIDMSQRVCVRVRECYGCESSLEENAERPTDKKYVRVGRCSRISPVPSRVYSSAMSTGMGQDPRCVHQKAIDHHDLSSGYLGQDCTVLVSNISPAVLMLLFFILSQSSIIIKKNYIYKLQTFRHIFTPPQVTGQNIHHKNIKRNNIH